MNSFDRFFVFEPLVQSRDMPQQKPRINNEIPPVGPEGGRVHPEVESAIQRARGGGQPLEAGLQKQMSAGLGYNFSKVRIHTSPEADKLSRQLSARAFTIGLDVFFAQRAYNPDTRTGRELIAHELVHVVQQNNGRVSGEGKGMTIRPAGDVFEQEADKLSLFVDGGRKAKTSNILQRRHSEGVIVQRDLQGQTGNITGYPMGMPKSCVNVVLYWLCREVLAFDPNPTTQARMLTACGSHTPQFFMDNLAKKGKKRSRRRGNHPIIVDAGSVLFFTYSGRVEHVCVMDAHGLTGLNQGGWWTVNPPAGAHVCPANGLCTHPPAEINWSGWYNASVKRGGRDHSVYTLSGYKAVNAVKKNLGV